MRVHVGTNKRIASGSEVGGKKFYPSLKAQLKYVLQEIVPTLEVSHTPPSFMARGTTPIAPNIVKLSGLQGADYSVSHINQVPGDRQSEEQVEVLIS